MTEGMITKRKRNRKNERVCTCKAYTFPHRHGGGDCGGGKYICDECGMSTDGDSHFRRNSHNTDIMCSECGAFLITEYDDGSYDDWLYEQERDRQMEREWEEKSLS